MVLYKGRKEFYIRADLRASFSCLSFPDYFHRAKKNSIDLFHSIVGLSVSGVYQYSNERAFHLNFEKGYILLFKLFGNQSNVILFNEGSVVEIFRNNLKKDFNISLRSLGKEIKHDVTKAWWNDQIHDRVLQITKHGCCVPLPFHWIYGPTSLVSGDPADHDSSIDRFFFVCFAGWSMAGVHFGAVG